MTSSNEYINIHGDVEWRVNGKLHRVDGPAQIFANRNYKAWWLNGERHRTDGPAIVTTIMSHLIELWFLNDNELYNVNEWVKENNFTIPFDEPTQMMFLMKFG